MRLTIVQLLQVKRREAEDDGADEEASGLQVKRRDAEDDGEDEEASG